ncbi:alpha/beta hydrolase [Mycobacterium vicinigordonae]|uniref:Alpha/beta hydrolase n=1 Tax=Mycobacterium vicinigordonae TaxID=1719132 RepID=A0A7D6EBP5_9MYCO|nr:alpha/beta hydrolase [Mycobacterium vicinigordonae]QLL09245.1 alpha/beta hydrolase [Mycobacterium vicinigordonae]
MLTTLDGFAVPVGAAGPPNGTVVVILADEQRAPAAYDAVCQRLHNASLRTVVIGADPRLTAKSVIGILDSLGIAWAVVVGDRGGAALAWELAATKLGRFAGLVAIDRAHPRVTKGGDENCPPVEIATTVLASSPAVREAARGSQWLILGDYRVVDMLGRRNANESTAQLATEIILRTSGW